MGLRTHPRGQNIGLGGGEPIRADKRMHNANALDFSKFSSGTTECMLCGDIHGIERLANYSVSLYMHTLPCLFAFRSARDNVHPNRWEQKGGGGICILYK